MNPGLIGGLYIESPYIDVLRTISNPELPLTLLETKEFGVGTDFVDVVETARWSPMEHIPTEGIPDLFILARTDEQDLQVYPYEVLKFIERARSSNSGRPKLLQISKGKGHFATTTLTREQDCWLLNKTIGHKYTKMSGLSINTSAIKAAEILGDLKHGQYRKNRGASRKNRTQRKNKTNRVNRNRMNKTNRANRSNRNRSNRNRSNRNRSNRNRSNRKNKTNRRNRN
jgi:hypothetical protein